jgi:hypothetical protein
LRGLQPFRDALVAASGHDKPHAPALLLRAPQRVPYTWGEVDAGALGERTSRFSAGFEAQVVDLLLLSRSQSQAAQHLELNLH